MHMPRVMIFLDGGYLLRGAEALAEQSFRLDYSGFLRMLGAGRKVIRAYFYNAWLRQSDDPDKCA